MTRTRGTRYSETRSLTQDELGVVAAGNGPATKSGTSTNVAMVAEITVTKPSDTPSTGLMR